MYTGCRGFFSFILKATTHSPGPPFVSWSYGAIVAPGRRSRIVLLRPPVRCPSGHIISDFSIKLSRFTSILFAPSAILGAVSLLYTDASCSPLSGSFIDSALKRGLRCFVSQCKRKVSRCGVLQREYTLIWHCCYAVGALWWWCPCHGHADGM